MVARSPLGYTLSLTAALLAVAALHGSASFLGSAGFLGSGPPASRSLRGFPAIQVASAGAKTDSEQQAGAPWAQMTMPLAGLVAVMAVAQAGRAAWGRRRSPRAATALRVTSRTQWYRKVKRLGGDKALFDVTVPKPLGLELKEFPNKDGCGIFKVRPDGNADKINRRVCVDDEPGSGMWMLEGDHVMAVNGTDVENATLDELIKVVQASEGDELTLTLMRNTRLGPVMVVVMPEGKAQVIRRGCRLSVAAEWTKGAALKYGCIDGWCGTCWHRERATNMVFKPCCDVLTGDWDNVMPLVITPRPEKAGDQTYLNPRGT